MKRTTSKIIDKLSLLPEERKMEFLDFIEFLLSKNHEITLSDINKSLDDIKKGNINKIDNNDDLNKHFSKLEI